MAVIRPQIQLQYGRVQMPLRVDIRDLLVGDPVKTVLTADIASGNSTLTVKNITGFAVNQILLIGSPDSQQSEIIKTHASSAPSGSTITLASNTTLNHSSSTTVTVIPYDQVEFSRATTATGSKSILATNTIPADQRYTEYNDTTNTSGYYFARFKETIGGTFSTYSDYVQYAGYGTQSAGAIIRAALQEINKKKSEVLSDEFFYTQLDMCQTEVLRELKRWSFMQKFDSIVATATTGMFSFAVPTDLDDQNTNKSVYQIRIGKEQRLIWVDKEKWDEFFFGVAYTTLASTLNVGDTSMVLTNSGDFGSSGTVNIGAYSYTFTANNTSTNTLTISAVPSGQNQASGANVFMGASPGLPKYWTTWGGNIYMWPFVASDYNNQNIYMDYYTQQVQITSDNTNIPFPDPSVAIYFLCWKALRKLDNGEDTEASLAFKTDFLERMNKMKQKETLGKTFKMRPRIQNFNIQTNWDEGDSRNVRTASFPNTGF